MSSSSMAITSTKMGLLPSPWAERIPARPGYFAPTTAVQIDAALPAAAAGLIVRTPGLPSPSFEALDDGEAPLLTPRETEVLAAIADGLSNKAAARRLGISQHTVKFHVESLFRKLGAVTRADAVRKGLRERLFEI